MTEAETLIKEDKVHNTTGVKNNILVINDSDYKNTRISKINFSTKYLSFKEEIKVMMQKNLSLYTRNLKTLLFVFLTPIIFLGILQILQNVTDYYNNTIVVKDHNIREIDKVSLKCTENPYGDFEEGCLSIGIAVIGQVDDKERDKVEFIMNYIKNETNLDLGADINLISNDSNEGMYDYLNSNPNKVQYVVAFCFMSFDIGGVEIPCRPNLQKDSTKFNLYTIVYNITTVPNGFLESFNNPLPSDERILRLKIVVDNAYMAYYSNENPEKFQTIPKLVNITTQSYPSPISRFNSNANVISLFGVLYLFFPPMILFSILLLDLVKEKESMLKNYTNIYGLSLIGYWSTWLLISLLSSLAVTLELVLLGKFFFHYDIFDNVNILIPFTLFFLFCFSMQILAMFISCVIKTTKEATAVSYSLILIGIIIQSLFTNYGIIYFFFATNLDGGLLFLVKLVLVILHFYPPFLFSKSYLNISRICSFHFETQKMQWLPGRYFSLSDIFTREVGKLRIGIDYEVDSLFQTFIWFYLVIIFFAILVALSEMKESYKYESYSNKGFFANIKNSLRLMKDLYSLASVRRLNIKKQRMEDEINKKFDKYLKNEQRMISLQNDENLSFIVKDNHISVVNEKKIVGTFNKKGTVPNGLRIISVCKTYENGLKALTDINIEISKGEVFTILGPNGAGKSTLINILTSQISSTEGFAKVGPFIIHSDLFIDSIYLKRMIGICSQFDYLWEELTVYETLFLYSRLRGISETKLNNYIDEKIADVGLEKKKNERVSNLSGGMRRRLSICISTLGDPLIIFMDEPTSGLDPNNRRRIWKLINSIKKNRVIILTTHNMDEAEYLSDRLGIIIGGKLRFIGNCTELRKLHWEGIILTLFVDLTKLENKFFIFDDNIKFIFVHSQIKYSSAGIYQIFIKQDNKKDMIKAFEIFKRKSSDERTLEIFDYLKEASISQANIENIYLDLCQKYT